MISEKIFAKSYISFWENHTPWLNDYCSGEMAQGKRLGKSIDIEENPRHVYINNIVATTHYKNISADQDYPLEKSMEDSMPMIKLFPGRKWEDYTLTDNYRKIILIQVERLEGKYGTRVKHNPFFPGYGIMANCSGDLISGSTLVEIKAQSERGGRKPFRNEDFRQLLVYCALNNLANQKYDIKTIQLFNPRIGRLWQSDLEEFVQLISNNTSVELFQSIGDFLTELSDPIDLDTGFNEFDYQS